MKLSILFILTLALVAVLAIQEPGKVKLTAAEKRSSKLEKLREEADSLRQSLAEATPEGFVVLKTTVPAATVQAKLDKIDRKLAELEGKPLENEQAAEGGEALLHQGEATNAAHEDAAPHKSKKQVSEQDLVKQAFHEQYVASLTAGQSSCVEVDAKKANKALLSMQEKAQLKISQARCKLEKAEHFAKFVEEYEAQKQQQAEQDAQNAGAQGEHTQETQQRQRCALAISRSC